MEGVVGFCHSIGEWVCLCTEYSPYVLCRWFCCAALTVDLRLSVKIFQDKALTAAVSAPQRRTVRGTLELVSLSLYTPVLPAFNLNGWLGLLLMVSEMYFPISVNLPIYLK